MKRNQMLHLLFGVVVIIELTGRITDNITLEYAVKPLLMIWIATYFILNRKKSDFTIPVLGAFFFSWVGDILLMFSANYEIMFYAGVGSFFFAQLFYIYTFSKYSENNAKGFIRLHPLYSLLFLVYLAGIYILLYPGLEGIMKAVILVYAFALISMSLLAFNRKTRVNDNSFYLVFIGSVLFVLSDSMIAINKFHTTLPLAGLWIMITYISAQYMIMRGLILEQPFEH